VAVKQNNNNPTKDTMTKPVLFSKEHDICSFASKNASRCVLQSVHYDANGKFLEATNGRQLVRVPAGCSEDFPPVTGANGQPLPDCLLPLAPFQKALKSIAHSTLPILENIAFTAVENDKTKVRLTTNDLDTENSIVVKLVHGHYPNTNVVIPVEPVVFAITLNALELQILVNYAAKHASEKNNGITFQFIDERSPVRWKIKTQQNRDVTGVLMPARPI